MHLDHSQRPAYTTNGLGHGLAEDLAYRGPSPRPSKGLGPSLRKISKRAPQYKLYANSTYPQRECPTCTSLGAGGSYGDTKAPSSHWGPRGRAAEAAVPASAWQWLCKIHQKMRHRADQKHDGWHHQGLSPGHRGVLQGHYWLS